MAVETAKTFKASGPKTIGRIYSDAFYRYGNTLYYTLNFSMNCTSSGAYFDHDWQCKLYLNDSEIHYSYVKGRTGDKLIRTTEYFMHTGVKSGSLALPNRSAGSATIKVEGRYGFSKPWGSSSSFTTNSWILYYAAIPEPSTPTVSYATNTPVNGQDTKITVTARVSSNPQEYYTLVLEEVTSGTVVHASAVGATSQAATFNLVDFYDRVRYFRARVYRDNVDYTSNNLLINIPAPYMPVWFHDGTQLRHAKRVYYFPTANNPKLAKAVWFNNGGAYMKK